MSSHFFDVGANVGQTFDQFLCTTNVYDGWTVWCFEPSPRHHAALLKKSQEMRDRFVVKVCPFGLSDRSAIVRFFEKDDALGDSFEESLAGMRQTNNLINGYEIMAPVFSICDFISHMTKPNDCIHVKIDAEGAEYAILDNLAGGLDVQDRVKKLWVEFHNCPSENKYRSREDLEGTFKRRGLPIEEWLF
jgi:FkbM family methyltransferase